MRGSVGGGLAAGTVIFGLLVVACGPRPTDVSGNQPADGSLAWGAQDATADQQSYTPVSAPAPLCALTQEFPIDYEHIEGQLQTDRLTIFAVKGDFRIRKGPWSGCGVTLWPRDEQLRQGFHQLHGWHCQIYCFTVHGSGGSSAPFPCGNAVIGWLQLDLTQNTASLCLFIAGTPAVRLSVEAIPLTEQPFW